MFQTKIPTDGGKKKERCNDSFPDWGQLIVASLSVVLYGSKKLYIFFFCVKRLLYDSTGSWKTWRTAYLRIWSFLTSATSSTTTPSTTSLPTLTTSATRSTRRRPSPCSCKDLQFVFFKLTAWAFSCRNTKEERIYKHYCCITWDSFESIYIYMYVCLQEEQWAVCCSDHSSPRVSSVPAAALHVFLAAALPENNAYQNAHWGEKGHRNTSQVLLWRGCCFEQGRINTVRIQHEGNLLSLA